MSILSTLPAFFFCNSLALNELLSENGYYGSLNSRNEKDNWDLWSFIASQQRDNSRPEHVFHLRWAKFRREVGLDLFKALNCVGEEYLEARQGKLVVRNAAAFSRWQNLRSRMTLLPVKVYRQYQLGLGPDASLAHPYFQDMDELIAHDGLNETHLHLHGYFYPEECWLGDLRRLESLLLTDSKKFAESKETRELYASVNPLLTPQMLGRRMKLARLLRETVVEMLENPSGNHDVAVRRARLSIAWLQNAPSFYQGEGLGTGEVPFRAADAFRHEQMMWYRAFEISDTPTFRYKDELQAFLHLYLLIQNEYAQLNRHNEWRRGFEAFAKSSDHVRPVIGSREYYMETFAKMLKSSHANGRNCMEVRITPQKLQSHGLQLARWWVQACRSYYGESSHEQDYPQLILVAHFIKRRSSVEVEESMVQVSSRFETERNRYMQEAAMAAETAIFLRKHNGQSVGIDAASSELKVPAEVFAPAYRLFAMRSHITHKTFHCGEDYHHLISGVRAVYEAVTFLDLRDGNRIGHGTSIGILPRVWQRSMPAKLVVKQGDWLMDLLFVWKMLRGDADVSHVEDAALTLAGRIFEKDNLHLISMHGLADLFDARGLMPNYVNHFLADKGGIPLTEPMLSEWALIRQFAKEKGRIALDLYKLWNYDVGIRSRQEEDTEVETDFLSTDLLLKLQQRVQRLLCERRVVIETPPVSNLRISQYDDICEHHVLRWLGIPSCAVEGDERPEICMGSDDPGIFVTDIRNEYFHLFCLLQQAGVKAGDAVEYLRRVNETGRIYAFKDIPPMSQ